MPTKSNLIPVSYYDPSKEVRLSAYADTVVYERERRGDLKRLNAVSIREKIDAWVLRCDNKDANIISIVENGLRSGAILESDEVFQSMATPP